MYIFDIDGTLANADHRLHFILNHEGKKIHAPHWNDFLDAARDDPPINGIVEVLRCLSESYPIVLSTGRREDQREMTIEWLGVHVIPFDTLLMRPLGDYRSDTIVKPEVLKNHFGYHPIHEVRAIFEDRARVTAAWRALGYQVCQVAEGDY